MTLIDSTRTKLVRTGQCGSVSQPPSLLRSFLRGVALFALLLVALPSAFAQLTSADIVGTVTDPTGAVISGATVTVTNVNTHEQRSVTSSASGEYQFNLLRIGVYTVVVQAPGFKGSTTQNLAIEAGDRARADVRMETGGQSDSVTVEAQTPLLQGDNATVSSTVTSQAVQDLPLNGRNLVQLIQLVPGVNEGQGNGLSSGGRPDDRRSNSGFSVNGQDDTLNNFIVDGIDNNERIIGTIGVKPSVEAIQEITIQTNSYSPEAGRTAGGVINIVTKTGTNQFHGSAFEFFRNDVFDAKDVQTLQGQRKSKLRQNQFGGSLGGPIFHDRTFFFGDYEGLRKTSGVTYKSTIPVQSEYDAIHSLNGRSPRQLVDSGAGTQGLPIDPIALKYLMLFPAPNTASLNNNFVTNPNRTEKSNLFDVRIDHKFNDRNFLFGRYSYNKDEVTTPPALGTVNGLQISGGRYIFAGPAQDLGAQIALSYTHIFSSNLIGELKAGYTRINVQSLPLNYGLNADTTLGFGSNMNFNSFSNFLTPIAVGPFSDIGDGAFVPLQDIDNTFQYLGTLSYTRGKHNLKFGVSYLRRQARNVQSAFAAGQYGFGLNSDRVSGNQLKTQDNNLASTLVGAFSSASRNYDLNPPDYRTFEPSGFIQDNYRLNSQLTLVFGVRYDVFTPFTEAHNRIANFDFYQALGLTPQTVGNALKVANVNGVDGKTNIKTDYSNVAPRVGFAFTVTPKVVVRGGYGLSYFPGNYTSNANLKNAPFVSVYSPNCISSLAYQIQIAQGQLPATLNPDCATVSGASTTFDQGLPIPASQTINSPSLSFNAEAPKFRSALIQQFNLQVEQQFGANVLTIGFVGNTGQHLPEQINDINVPKPGNPSTGASNDRPLKTILPNLGSVGLVQSEGISNYNALQMSFQRRFNKGLAFDANYTYAKALSDITGFSQEGQEGWSNADPTRIGQIEYGVAENNIAHRFALSLNYEFQYGKNFTGIKRQALAGWHANTIVVWQSGKPFTIVNSRNGPGGLGNRATPVNNGGQDRPNQLRDARGPKKLDHWFDTTAFVAQPLGTVGTTQRNSLFGPRFRHIDASLFKDFPITERLKLQFRAEAFDITNTPNYYVQNNSFNGSTQFGNSAFGTVQQTDPNYNPRQLQFALKAQF